MPAPIRDHALLSDCETTALVTSGGAVDRWPAPRFDVPSALSALLDDGAGHRAIRPEEPFEHRGACPPDPATAQALGNFLQTIAHVGLVNAAPALTEAHASQGAVA